MTNDDTGARRLPAPAQKLLIAILLLATGALLTTVLGRTPQVPRDSYAIFWRLFLFNDYYGAVAMLVAFLVAFKLPPLQRAFIRLAQWVGEHPRATCALAFVALAVGSLTVYLAHPFAMDEYAPVLQANAFAHGDLAVHYPPSLIDRIVFAPFQGSFILVNRQTGEAMSGYWPGLAMLETPFVLIHATWMLNAALTALALWLVGDLAAQIPHAQSTPTERRGWAMLAALASPAFTISAMSFYAMPGLLALDLLCLWLLVRDDRRSAFAAGVVGSIALVLHNPLPHALMALPCLVWLAADRTRWARLACVIAGYLPFALLLGVGWPLLTSSMHMARSLTADPHAGFVSDWIGRLDKIITLPSLTLLQARFYATWKIWIWACPGLLLAPFILRPTTAVQRLLLAGFVLTFVAYFLVPFDQGHGWGYRYIHPVWGLLPIAGGVLFAREGATRTLGAIAVAAGLIATPVFLWTTHATIAQALAKRIEPTDDDGRWIVFVAPQEGGYTFDLVQNLPGHERVLYLVSGGFDSDRAMMAQALPQAKLEVRDQRGSAWRWSDAAAPAAAAAPKN